MTKIKPILEDLNDLHYFSVIAEQGGYSAASRVLNISKSVLSTRINALEKRLGVRLFQRTTRNISLTYAGTLFLPYCQSIVAEALLAQRMAEEIATEPRGCISISCPLLATKILIAPVIHDFVKHYPKVDVRLIATDRKINIVEESIDIAIRIRHPEHMEQGLSTRIIGKSRRVLVASREFMETRKIQSPADLNDVNTLCLGEDEGMQTWTLVNIRGESEILKHRPKVICTDDSVIMECAKRGVGIALLPYLGCITALQDGELVRVLSDWEAPHLTVHAVYSSRNGMLPAVRAFLDFLANNLPGSFE